MTRGDIVTIALQGDHGKPRPALIVQSDLFAASSHVAVLLLTSTSAARVSADAPLMRITIEAEPSTGLTAMSFAMLDRITTAPREKIGRIIGRAGDATMVEVNRSLAVFLGLA